jgi:hypothetical protein
MGEWKNIFWCYLVIISVSFHAYFFSEFQNSKSRLLKYLWETEKNGLFFWQPTPSSYYFSITRRMRYSIFLTEIKIRRNGDISTSAGLSMGDDPWPLCLLSGNVIKDPFLLHIQSQCRFITAHLNSACISSVQYAWLHQSVFFCKAHLCHTAGEWRLYS